MNLGLKTKKALVTAASTGLGYAIAQALVAEGSKLAICSRDQERVSDAARRLEDSTDGAKVFAYQADVTRATDQKELFEKATTALGGLDILVCNAGGPPSGNFSTIEEHHWEAAYNLTLMSVVRSIRLALPHFRVAGGGAILTVVSSSVIRPIDNLLLSNVFRPAVQGLCKSLALEVASENVRVNCLAPGRIKTGRTDHLDQAVAKREDISLEEVRARSVASIPMGRLGRTREFGEVAAFLCSDVASYISGSTVLVDGGAARCHTNFA